MPLDIFLALAWFSFVSSITPGPNNIMLLASGVNYGFQKSIPHMLGISGGFAILLLCVGLGLGQLLEHFPIAFIVLKFAGAAYLIYLAYKIAKSGPVDAKKDGEGQPMTFLQAALFQWVNPKAWVMAITSMAVYTSQADYIYTVLIVVATFTAINLPCVSSWTLFGTNMRIFLSDPKRLRIFNYIMAVSLVLSLWPMLR